MDQIELKEVLSIYKQGQVDEFLRKYTGLDLNEDKLNYEKIEKYFRFLGDNMSNGSNTSQLTTGEKGLVERLTNAIDSVIEKEKIKHNISTAKNSSVIIKKAFPKYYSNMMDVMNDSADRSASKDAEDKVVLSVNDGSKSNKPTLDVIDYGTGLSSDQFATTILSINKGNKLSRDKSYLIGAFGQGGSTSLPFTYATMIVSKKNNKYAFTIIKRVELVDYKNYVFVYLTVEGKVPELSLGEYESKDKYLTDFVINGESGTLVRMIETEITKRFRDNEVTKPGMLADYLNTELFNVGLPVKVIENREQYKDNKNVQNRSVHGSLLKLKTSKKYVKKEYCGNISIEHNNRPYNIEYYVLLPYDESKWGNDAECKTVFEQFNVYYDPIIYTVNGQTIATERYTKLNNAGLNFLRFRLLVIINLDGLETEKYRFFTSDRSRIVHSDLSIGFLDKVVRALAKTENLIDINNIIANQSISSTINKDLLVDVSRQVKNQYAKYLKTGSLTPGKTGGYSFKESEEVYEDRIVSLEITSERREFNKDENVIFVLTTKAQKHVNQNALIYMYIDKKAFYDYQATFMNGRIQYSINAGALSCAAHTLHFGYYVDNKESLKSDDVPFKVLNEITVGKEPKNPVKELDLNITVVDESSLICDISRDTINKRIEIKLCLDTDQLRSEVYGISSSTDEVTRIKNRIIKPIVLFTLFYGDSYENIFEDEDKNRLVLSYIKSYVSTIDEKSPELL